MRTSTAPLPIHKKARTRHHNAQSETSLSLAEGVGASRDSSALPDCDSRTSALHTPARIYFAVGGRTAGVFSFLTKNTRNLAAVVLLMLRATECTSCGFS